MDGKDQHGRSPGLYAERQAHTGDEKEITLQKTTIFERLSAVSRDEAAGKVFSWVKLAGMASLAMFLFVFMEWLFLVTRPSFMDLLPFANRMGILLLSWLALVGISLPFFLALIIASVVPGLSRFWKVFLWAGGILPPVFLALTALMLVDNFSYTMFKFGIASTKGTLRGVYGLAFGAAWVFFYREALQALGKQTQRKKLDGSLKGELIVNLGLLVISVPLGATLFFSGAAGADEVAGRFIRQPDIVLIGGDGVNAEHMSLYGYERDTTPFLREFAEAALVSENNLANSTVTAGSLVSMFTSKLPTETRMLYPPDIVRGADAFEHLPRLLKQAGYYNAQMSVDYYGDANVLNLQDGFVLINDRPVTVGRLYTLSRRFLPEDPAYFISTVAKRVSDRVFHIFYVRAMPNPYSEVVQNLITFSDQDKLNQVKTLLNNVHQPLFLHVHLMGTHEGNLSPESRVFSAGEEPTVENAVDFYDDAVLDFDGYLRQLVGELKQAGRLENTLIIVYSDHGTGNTSNVRLPLLFRFPNGEHIGRRVNNTQNLDIAPTVLEYLGVEPPKWMRGLSLLPGEPPAGRPIFSMAPNYRDHNDMGRLQLDLEKVKPPFYQFGTIGMVICQNWYALDTATLEWREAQLAGYAGPCQEETLPGREEAQVILLEQLQRDGFDVSTLREVWGK